MVKKVQVGILKIRMLKMKNLFVAIIIGFFFLACGEEPKKYNNLKPKTKAKPQIERPAFSEDSAYVFIEQQLSFGPRVPNTEAHKKAGVFLANKMRSFEFEVIEQEATVTAFNDKKLEIKNIIGSYRKDLNNRILLFAHWDTRPFADNDTKDRNKPIDGANDGASGVGVLLEIARQIQLTQPKIGVDIIFFDAEDYGQPISGMGQRKAKTWCLGSQYWGANPHQSNYRANYGILLDMVGGANATFPRERGISMHYAPTVVDKVWNVAAALGHGNHFVFEARNYVSEDDHLYVNELMKIPSIDIIQYDKTTGAFAPYWHTHDDNMSSIDKNTLEAVGETVLATVLTEAKSMQ